MRKIGWIVCLSMAIGGFAKEESSSKSQADVIAPNLRGIVLLGSWEQLRTAPECETAGVSARGVVLGEDNSSFLDQLKSDYVGKPLTRETLSQLKDQISEYSKKRNQPFTLVSIPKQSLANGILYVIVEEAKLGEVRTNGNRYFSGAELKQYIRTKPGHSIDMGQVVEDLAWMNQNPFRRTDAVFVPGAKPGTADIELATTDRWPYRIYAGADDTGTIATMRDRIFFGFNFGKTILPDSQVSYQFTCSPNWNRFYAHTASARVPCPWRHVFVFWGGYTQVEPSLDGEKESEDGVSWQVDGRYRIPLSDAQTVMHELVIGYDFKETNNRVKFDGETIFKATADINQFMLGYELGSKGKCQRVTLTAEVYANPSGITDKNEKSDYEQFRYGASPLYAYLKVAHSFARKMEGGWWLSYDLSGQVASKNLLPSEQFNLTGYDAVRGFEERVLIVDNAALFDLVFETPHWSPAKWCGAKRAVDDLYFLSFFDCGFGCNHQRAPGEKKFKSLGSVGPGVRYQFSRYATARLDYGFQLWHKGFYNPSHSRYNFGVIISY